MRKMLTGLAVGAALLGAGCAKIDYRGILPDHDGPYIERTSKVSHHSYFTSPHYKATIVTFRDSVPQMLDSLFNVKSPKLIVIKSSEYSENDTTFTSNLSLGYIETNGSFVSFDVPESDSTLYAGVMSLIQHH